MADPAVTFRPIGVIHTPYTDKPDTPRQPGASGEQAVGVITLLPGKNFEEALRDLAGFERIWILTFFDRARGWKPKVLPPRGRTRRGLFATRSPHRPNALGLTLCRLLSIRGRILTVENPDLLDGTPVLDIKPYLPGVEAHPEARSGWLEPLENAPAYQVVITGKAAEQLAWLHDWQGITLEPRIRTALSRDPHPHPYRRIKPGAEGTFVLSIKSWRVIYRIAPAAVTVEEIASGYAATVLQTTPSTELHDGEAHKSFAARWPSRPEKMLPTIPSNEGHR